MLHSRGGGGLDAAVEVAVSLVVLRHVGGRRQQRTFEGRRPEDTDQLLARAEGEVRPAVAHEDRVLAVGVVLDEGGRHARERRECLGLLSPQLLGHCEGIDQSGLAALDAAVKGEAVQKLQPGRRLIVAEVHVRREWLARVGDVDRPLLRDDVPRLAVDLRLDGADEPRYLGHLLGLARHPRQQRRARLMECREPAPHRRLAARHELIIRDAR